MDVIESIIERAKENKKRIVLPEANDERILEATIRIVNEDIADIILIGDANRILEINNNIDINRIEIINPSTSDMTHDLIEKLYERRKDKGLSKEEAKKLLLNDYMYYASMLVYVGYADGAVSGSCHETDDTLRPALQIIKAAPDKDLVSAFFLMEVPNCEYGYNGTFIFADSGLVQNPTSNELASIAKDSADSFKLLTGSDAIVAFLSHSTMGSASHPSVVKVRDAVNIVHKKYSNYLMDGEMQLDTAIVESVAKNKAPNSKVAGHANVLIFPELDSGNIGYKLVERLANAKAYGPITQGLLKPVNDLSRGCSVEDIIGVVAITSVQASNGE